MRHYPLTGIRIRTLLLGVLPAAALALGLTWFFTSTRLADSDKSFAERASAVTQQLASASLYGLFTRDVQALEQAASVIYQQPDVVSLRIEDEGGETLLSMPCALSLSGAQALAADKLVRVFSAPVEEAIKQPEISDYPDQSMSVESTQAVLGKVEVGFSYRQLHDRQQDIIRTSILLTLLGLLAAAAFSLALSRRIVTPLERLTEAVRQLRHGHFHTRIAVSSQGEIRTLEEGFNEMAREVQQTQDSLQSQVSQATGELIETVEALEIQNVELDLARKRAIEASRAKSEFLANMSHEIRTPMNGIIGFGNLLKRSELNSSQQDFVRIINRSAGSLMDIISDILDFSRLEAGRMRLEQENFDVLECLDDAVALLTPSAHEKGLELILLIYDEVPPLLRGDAKRLRQILINLLGNAIKFTEQGEITIRVMLKRVSEEGVRLGISVLDSGIGIPLETQRRLFEPFNQGAYSTGNKFGGTGLGLSISRKLAEVMGGAIHLDSAPGEGATFTVTVNLEKSAADAQSLDGQGEALRDSQVLLYDEHHHAGIAVAYQLNRWRARVSRCESVAQFEDGLANAPDLVIIGVGAAAVLERRVYDLINLSRRQSGAPILVLTSNSDHAVHTDIVAHGANRCHAKPISHALLYRTLRSLLRHHRKAVADQDKLAAEPAVPNLAGRRFLVADDNQINRILIRELLTLSGAEVVTVENGRKVVEQVRAHDFDVLILDVHMPDIDGLEAARKIRAIPEKSALPMIALTADATPATREAVNASGMNAYMVKPVDAEHLWSRIQSHLSADTGPQAPMETIPPVTELEEEPLIAELPIRDPVRALAVAGGNQPLADQLLAKFMETLPNYLASLEECRARGDWSAFRELAHKLRGSTSYCALLGLQNAVEELEKAVDHKELSGIGELMEKLTIEAERLRQTMNNM